MVTLVIPSSTCNNYFVSNGFLCGPLARVGGYVTSEVEVPMDGSFSAEKGIFGENSVDHTKFEGQVKLVPGFAYITKSPLPLYPNRIIMQVGTKTLTANYGFLGSGLVTHTPLGTHSFTAIAAEEWEDGKGATFYSITYTPDPNITNWTLTVSILDLSFGSFNAQGTYVNLYGTTNYATIPFSTNVDLRPILDNHEIGKIAQMYIMMATKVTVGTTSSIGTILSAQDAGANVSTLISTIQGELFHTSRIIDYTPPYDYGDLAMEASLQVNATGINMLQFLKDLRHPTQLIPKLKNLNTIKGLSDNYLTVKYGILPTVSDLGHIYDAFEKIKPFLDRNGYSVFGAGHTTAVVMDSTLKVNHYQRLKLAVANEDSGLIALANKLEQIGMFPSMENIWDLIPYSFVMDWFVDVGGFLERVDTRLRLLRLTIPYVTMSHKVEAVKTYLPFALLPLCGSVTVVRYHRWVTDQCPVPALSLQPGSGLSDHWLEGGALLVQRAH